MAAQGLAALIPSLTPSPSEDMVRFVLCERLIYERVWQELLEQLLPLAVDGFRVPLGPDGEFCVCYIRFGLLR
jgi:hypothetical protein